MGQRANLSRDEPLHYFGILGLPEHIDQSMSIVWIDALFASID